MASRRNRLRAWSVYSHGVRIAELRTTTAAIKATLPNAIVDEEVGTVTLVGAVDLGLKWRPVEEEKEMDYDAE